MVENLIATILIVLLSPFISRPVADHHTVAMFHLHNPHCSANVINTSLTSHNPYVCVCVCVRTTNHRTPSARSGKYPILVMIYCPQPEQPTNHWTLVLARSVFTGELPDGL